MNNSDYGSAAAQPPQTYPSATPTPVPYQQAYNQANNTPFQGAQGLVGRSGVNSIPGDNMTRLEHIDNRLAMMSQTINGIKEHQLGVVQKLRGAFPSPETKEDQAPAGSGLLGKIEDRLSWMEKVIATIAQTDMRIAEVI